MQCRTCGTALPPGSAFCPKCGTATPSHVSRQEVTHGAAITPHSSASGGILPPPPPPGGTPLPYTAPPPSEEKPGGLEHAAAPAPGRPGSKNGGCKALELILSRIILTLQRERVVFLDARGGDSEL
jgi:zinc-ribbon domain